MSRIARWLESLRWRSRARRIARPPLHVFYWTGAPSAAREVRDVSPTGAFILTDDHWFPGTVMHLILQCANEAAKLSLGADYFGVWAKVVRRADAGLGVQFLWGDRRERVGFRRFIGQIGKHLVEEQMTLPACDAAGLTHDPSQPDGNLTGPAGNAPDALCEPGPESLESRPSAVHSLETATADSPRTRDGRTGSTLIEFAFVLFPLLAMIFGAIEMNRMLLVYNAVANSARAAVRYAVVHGHYNPTTTNNIKQIAKTFAGMGLLDSSRATVSVSYEDGTDHIGSPVSVSVAYPFDPFTSFFPLSVTLRSTAKGTITF